MKKILPFLLTGLITFSVTAQTITLSFKANNNNNKNYQVLVDGTSYYSSNYNNTNGNANGKNEITLSNQQLGSHSLEVYRLRNNNGSYTNGTNNPTNGNSIYSKTFQLRQGYDMAIEVGTNGQVTFTEKRMRNRGNRGGYDEQTIPAMTDANFDQLVKNISNKWLQTQKISAENDAFNNTSNYFTTAQVRQLLLLISKENNRLSLAKLAYPRVVDPANFTQLYDVFSTSRSKNDMNVFIQNNPNNNNYNNENNNGNNQYRTAMADYQFNQLMQNVNNQYNQTGKINAVRDAFNNSNNYFSTSQIRQLLLLINTENDRLAVAKLSYARVTDAASFPSLYDVLYNQASRNELSDFIHGNNNTQYNTRTAMADYQFNQLMQNINNQWNQSGKINLVRDAFNNTSNYFSTSQIRQLLSLVNAQSDRLALAKSSYLRVSDASNFSSLYDLIYSQSMRDELNNYVVQNGGNTGYGNKQYNTRTPMSDATFSQLLQKAGNHFFPWDKVKDVKEDFNNTSYYFTTAQIRQLLTLVTSESDKLELAKLAWSRVTDPSYFTQLNDIFSSHSNRDDLDSYINAHPL